jgi:hypothetical protein
MMIQGLTPRKGRTVLPRAHRPVVAMLSLWCLAAGGVFATAAPALALSASAEKIITYIAKTTPAPDLQSVCFDTSKLRSTVLDATTLLAKNKQIKDPPVAGREAGMFIFFHCPWR